jgi:hypothetical protein
VADQRLVLYIPSERVLGPFRSDESPASIRKHYGVSLDDLRALLAAQDLYVITATDIVVTEAEAAVLLAMARILRQRLEWEAEQGSSPAKAELARRDARG